MKTLKLGLTTLLILLVGVLAVSTFLERLYGTEFAATNIYHTQWFLTLWMALAVVSVLMLLRRQVWKRVAVGLLHVSFLVILLGAAVSFVSSSEGTLHLRQGSSADYFFEKGKEESSKLPFTLRLDSFRIVNYAGTMAPADYESHVVCTSGGKSRAHVISMNHTLDMEGYRFYQTSFDSDQQGTILTVSHDVWGTRLTYAGYLLFALSMLGVMLSRSGEYRKLWRHRLLQKRSLFALLLVCLPLSGFTLLVAHLAEMNPQSSHLMPVLNSPILSLHVSVIMLAYALLAFTMLTGFFALMLAAAKQPAAEKSERLKQLTLFSRLLLYPAVFLLGCGIFLGAVWANISWGNYWSWDPKETWALITFLIYSIPFHQKIWRSLQNDKRYHLFMVLAFMSVLMTYFGVNYILGGLHSYA